MPKILVVDDEEHIRLLYSEELNEAGYEVISAESVIRFSRQSKRKNLIWLSWT